MLLMLMFYLAFLSHVLFLSCSCCSSYCPSLSNIPFSSLFPDCPSMPLPPELEELVGALHRVQSCLSDAQSQEDVELVLQLLRQDDFQNAFSIHAAVAHQMSHGCPCSPLTAQARNLCQEVG